MQRHISLLLAGFFFSSLPASQAADPDPHEILRQARLNHISQEARLEARLRSGTRQWPFTISLSNGEVRYQFSDPEETIILRLQEEKSELLVRRGNKDTPVQPSAGKEPIRDSSLTYEDLALRFLYWPGAKYLGTDTIRTRPAHRLELHPHRKDSGYAAARIWVDQASGALLRIEGYDWNGRLARRFEVISAQKIEDQWFLKTMRVESFHPTSGKVTARTYLDITGQSTPPAAP